MYARKTGSLSLMDPALAEYYKPLHTIIAGDLWSVERLLTIIKFNLGYYDEYKARYLASIDKGGRLRE